jgi:hypothetical protein
MKKIVILSAFALVAFTTHRSVACDWNHEAAADNADKIVVADCSGGANCKTETSQELTGWPQLAITTSQATDDPKMDRKEAASTKE